MASSSFWLSLALSVTLAHGQVCTTGTGSLCVGVCYGMMGDNLPSATDVVALYKNVGISSMRLFEPNPDALQALRGSQIDISLGVRNEDLPSIATSQEFANSWFSSNVAPYLNDMTVEYITVGNEVVPGEYASYVALAMQNLQNILDTQGLAGVSVTTVVSTAALSTSYPPSAGTFSTDIVEILRFLSAQASPLMVNVYPYFAYAADPANVPLDYALFTATGPVVQDGNLSYQNLFDAIIDAFYWAMEREGVTDVGVVVSETGWPSDGNGDFTTPELAATYNRNFAEHISKNGTPKRPQAYIEGYIFAMFNENLKPPGVEQHFGLFQPSTQPVYSLFPIH
ncbi:hypothetical protein RHGRI_008899 [Rhododendron griersonianum]|uniref:Glucan endo-1,3-beta-D-glucosidase n=1 Tax=Rhododendron griersonianum TaxID=479676 RepID=A0AAV6L3A4_9ERIC|nr:hypothetical protein RHGRI_008899 [Rhododendron griersonianum]